jgi:MFS family permease
MYQFNIVFGILIAFLSNYFLQGVGGANDWRWMLGVLAIPSIIYTVMVMGVPESPRWLVTKKNDLVKAKETLMLIGVEDADAEIASIIKSNLHESPAGKPAPFFSSKHKVIILAGIFDCIFQPTFGYQFHSILRPGDLDKK